MLRDIWSPSPIQSLDNFVLDLWQRKQGSCSSFRGGVYLMFSCVGKRFPRLRASQRVRHQHCARKRWLIQRVAGSVLPYPEAINRLDGQRQDQANFSL